MFVKIGNKHINMNNVTYVDDQNGERYAVHFANAEHQTLVFNNGVLRDSSYSDLRAWLKSQAGEVSSPTLYPGSDVYPS